MALVLASASPRRQALLSQLGLSHRVLPVNIDETVNDGETAEVYTQRLAREKAQAGLSQFNLSRVDLSQVDLSRVDLSRAVSDKNDNCVVIGADTVVCLDGNILGKPVDKAHALAMLGALSARRHCVITAFTVISAVREISGCCSTDVWLANISPAQREAYWYSGEPCDKAGAYAIQGLGGVFVERIQGSYSNVVGLPLHALSTALQAFGVDALRSKQ